jgi:hypothetical protein
VWEAFHHLGRHLGRGTFRSAELFFKIIEALPLPAVPLIMQPKNEQILISLHWFKNPALHQAGAANLNAVIVLADILTWQPQEQLSYQQMADKYGLTKLQVTKAVYFLRDAGLVTVARKKNIPVYLIPDLQDIETVLNRTSEV